MQDRTTAFLVVQCASCSESNEVEIPVGDRRAFTVHCCNCGRFSQVTLDTNGAALLVAEGLPEWSQEEPKEELPPASSVPPKKRQKSAILPAPTKEESDNGDGIEDEDEELLVEKATTAKVAKAKAKAPKPKTAPKPAAKPAKPVKATPKPTRSAVAAALQESEEIESAAPDQSVDNPKLLQVRRGSAVLAEFHDGYYYSAVVEEAQGHSSFLVAWDDGDEPSWVTGRQATHKNRQPVPAELRAKMAVLARWNGTVKVAMEEDADVPVEEESNIWCAKPAQIRADSGDSIRAALPLHRLDYPPSHATRPWRSLTSLRRIASPSHHHLITI